jgi:hypothetical protein
MAIRAGGRSLNHFLNALGVGPRMVSNDRPTCKNWHAAELIMARRANFHQRPDTLPQTCLRARSFPCSPATEHTLSVPIASRQIADCKLLIRQAFMPPLLEGRCIELLKFLNVFDSYGHCKGEMVLLCKVHGSVEWPQISQKFYKEHWI